MTRTRIALLAVFLAACQYRGDPQVAAIAGTERINREVTVTNFVPEPVSTDLAGKYWILLTNHSSRQYIFPIDLGVRLLVYSESAGQWRDVENLTTYLPVDGSLVLQPWGNWPEDEVPLSFWPIFDRRPDNSKLRVILVGQDEDGEAVAAYVEIHLNE